MRITITTKDQRAIRSVLAQFKTPKKDEDIFYHMCFCICAPQTTFQSNLRVIKELRRKDFYNRHIKSETLKQIVKPVRFLRKAEYLLKAKRLFPVVLKTLYSDRKDQEKRDALAKLIPGMGLKAASHFLRNLGASDVAIIDAHVSKFLKTRIPQKPQEYLEMERKFRRAAKRRKLSVAELDAFVWKTYSGTEWSDFVY